MAAFTRSIGAALAVPSIHAEAPAASTLEHNQEEGCAMKKKASAKELATLSLARAIIEEDAEAAMGALKAKADYDAFWVDGATRLRDLAKSRGARSVSQMIEEAARSRGL